MNEQMKQNAVTMLQMMLDQAERQLVASGNRWMPEDQKKLHDDACNATKDAVKAIKTYLDTIQKMQPAYRSITDADCERMAAYELLKYIGGMQQ